LRLPSQSPALFHIHRIAFREEITVRPREPKTLKPVASELVAGLESSRVDKVRRRNNRRLKALESAQDSAAANARGVEKARGQASLPHNHARRARVAETVGAGVNGRVVVGNGRVEASAKVGANAKVEANAKAGVSGPVAANAKVVVAVARVRAHGPAVVAAAERPPIRVSRAAVRVLRPDSPHR
jgi:hypothetical protein